MLIAQERNEVYTKRKYFIKEALETSKIWNVHIIPIIYLCYVMNKDKVKTVISDYLLTSYHWQRTPLIGSL